MKATDTSFYILDKRITAMEQTLKSWGDLQFSRIRNIEEDVKWLRKWRERIDRLGEYVVKIFILWMLLYFSWSVIRNIDIVKKIVNLGG